MSTDSVSCLDDNMVAAFVGGGLSHDATVAVATHLETCASCRQLVAALVRSERDENVTPSAADTLMSDPSAPSPSAHGSRLGRYIVLDTLGSGGMGVVYSAYDPILERKVAVKVVRGKGTAEAIEEVTARLLREGKIIARLSHPNIVTVFDMNAADGQVFIAMELVAGGSLKRWLKEKKRNWREVIETFQAAARGLAAAHEAGLVHRDFKPENVLVGDDGRVRVTDFGLASTANGPVSALPTAGLVLSEISSERLTRDGTLLGTPAYMAPEQYAGRGVDALSDQFSFCVALWEALFETRPFVTTAQTAQWRLIEPPASANVPSWLKRVLLKGLSLEPSARFSDMTALSAALGADPERRRRLRVMSATAAVLAATVVGVGIYGASVRADRLCTGAAALVEPIWNPATAATIEKAFNNSGFPAAAPNWDLTRRDLDAYWREWATMHTEACKATRVRGEQSDQILGLRMACLERRRREVSALIEIFKIADRDVVAKAPEAVDAIVSINTCADNELLLAQLPAPETPDLQTKVAVVSALLEDGKARFDTGRYKEALERATEAVKVSQALGYRPMHAEALLLLGRLQEHLGDLKAAEQTLLDAISTAEAGRHDAVTAQAATHLMLVLGSRQARYAEARAWGKLADGAIRRMGAGPGLQARLLQAEGLVAYAEGHLAEAIDFHQRAVALLEKLEPDSLTLAEALNSLGAAHRGGRNSKEALAAFERALAILLKKVGPDGDLVAIARNGIANAYMLDGRFDESFELYKQSHATFEKLLGPTHFRTVTGLNNLGVVLAEQGRVADALPYFEQVLKARESSLAATDAKTADAHANVGMLLIELKRFDEATAHFEKAQGILQGYPLDHFSQAEPLLGAAKVHLAKRQPSKAIAPLQRVLALCEDKKGFRFDYTRARASFLLGQAQWEDPRQRAQGHSLAVKARAALESFGAERFRRDLGEVDRWLARHSAL